MVRRPRSAADDLRSFIAAAVAQGMPRVEGMRALLAVRDLVLERAAPPPPGTPATVCRWVRTATQLAAAVDAGAVAEPNRNQARNLLAKWKEVLAAVEAWTDGGRRAPLPPLLPVHEDLPQAVGVEACRER
ncbi:hypothetical protein JY651_28725 [Pyxidicoccus parkwayensis]|uniref:Uncharacterized protein n=1 Tax=Pyxidicoccus parkwayensis TaxID=2813578 RepID=A0ABX7NKD9_9BACT|nr:hypothetical protein [Pyxidicoccus parkwaysis]QSQ19317.1 hypothetical protein JY651_28725 [Pyxidicoccus parkwaysis]